MWLYFNFIYFYINLVYCKAGYIEPMEEWYPTFMDNKGQTWGQVPWTRVLVFIYIYRIDVNIEQLISCWNKHNFQATININSSNKYKYFKFYKYTFEQYQVQATKYFEIQATKYEKLSLQVQCPVQSVAVFKLFFVDAINWTFLYLFLLASLE